MGFGYCGENDIARKEYVSTGLEAEVLCLAQERVLLTYFHSEEEWKKDSLGVRGKA